MILRFDTEVLLCEEENDENDVDVMFNFIPIKEITQRASNTLCGNNYMLIVIDNCLLILYNYKLTFSDLIGVISSIDECKTFYNRCKKKYCSKRDIMIADEDASIMFTLWEEQVISYNDRANSMISVYSN